jgi:hypothetical protein
MTQVGPLITFQKLFQPPPIGAGRASHGADLPSCHVQRIRQVRRDEAASL